MSLKVINGAPPPAPARRAGAATKYEFGTLEKGDAMFFPASDYKSTSVRAALSRHNAVNAHADVRLTGRMAHGVETRRGWKVVDPKDHPEAVPGVGVWRVS